METKMLTLIPPVLNEAKESVIKMLEDALVDAKEGKITCLVMIIQKTGGIWGNRSSRALNFAEAIGQLEITKYDWIQSASEGSEDD